MRRKVEGVGEFVRYICPMKTKIKIREFEWVVQSYSIVCFLVPDHCENYEIEFRVPEPETFYIFCS